MEQNRLNRLLEVLADWPELLAELREHRVWGPVLRGERLDEQPRSRRDYRVARAPR
ncbi:hypothetical protein [Deinococcus pimensis]|uniref:hypothetical protein n=1 Tax=Deinococcus pimensis TaxID=309888 RepID=UPI0004B76F09|nr:hypothetical protein [Deinococcus pimensis]